MRRGTALALGVLMALLGLADAGHAQAPQSIRIEATLRAVDCYAQTVTLDTGAGSFVYRAAGAATFYANSAGVALCDLRQYIGAPASVWLTALGNDLLITRIDAGGQAAVPAPSAPVPYTPAPVPYTPPPAPPAAYPYPYPSPAPYPYSYSYVPPLAGIVLGTVVVAGLIYLLVRHPSGYLYRYPYYGGYYRYYYHPAYRPYYGPYRYAPAFRWCPAYRGPGYWCR